MTANQFYKFLKGRKPEMIEPGLLGSFKIYFDTGEYVTVDSDRDGMVFRHQGEEVCNPSKLINELDLVIPDYMPGLIKKYGNVDYLITRGILGKTKP